MTTPRRAPEVLLRRYWNDPDTPVVTAGLSVLSWAYRAAIALRDRAYRLGVLPTGRLPCPVISVGNLTLGGTGKTPTVELVARTLQELGAAPAVLSRGYALVWNARDERLLRTPGEVRVGDALRIRLHGGSLGAEVTSKEEE